MNKSKWYSKVVNLAIVVALVVSAGVVVAALDQEGPVLATNGDYSELTLNITAPAANTTICVCSNFRVEFTITNTGINNCTATNIGVITPDIWPIGAATVLGSSGAFPNLAVGENATGWVDFHCTQPGEIRVHLKPFGWDTCRDTEITGGYAVSDVITLNQIERAKLEVTLDAPSPVCVCTNFTATVNVTNTGDAVAENVTPVLTISPPDRAIITVSPPVPVDINPDETASFNWTLHCEERGDVKISVNVTGVDECSGLEIPEEDITLPEPVTVEQLKSHLVVNITAPEEVCVSDDFTATVTVQNTGNIEALNVTPGLNVGGGATITVPPSPGIANISVNGTASFNWTLHCENRSAVQICANVTGIDGCTGIEIPEDNIDLPACLNVTQQKVHLKVGLEADPIELCVSDNFTATVTVTNEGNVEALNVTPSLSVDPGAHITVGPSPSSANISVNGTASFNWTLHCDAFGVVQIGANVTGQMAGACNGTDIPRANIILPAAINVTQQKAHLAVNFTAPSEVCVSDNFTATVTIINSGNVMALNVTPSLSVGAGAHITVNATPPSANIPLGGGMASFNWTLHCDAPGEVQICLNVTGQMAGTCNGTDIPADNIVGAPACINVTQQKVHLETGLEIDPTELCISQNFTAMVTVKNAGNVEALNVTPVLTYNPETGANCTALTPASSNITPGETVTFNSTCHCEEGGLLTVSLNVTGQMAGACNGTDIPVDNIILPAAVNVTQYPPLIIECDHDPEPGIVCNPVYFSANATGGAGNYTWLWDFGDIHCSAGENTSELQNPTHTYMCAGNYSANVTVTDEKCGEKTCTTLVTIIVPKPQLISPPNNTTLYKHEVTFEWEDIGCCNYTLEYWQKDGVKVNLVNVGKVSNWTGPVMSGYWKWFVTATDACGNNATSDAWFFEVSPAEAELVVAVTAPEQVNEGEEYYVSAVISNTGKEGAENVTASIEVYGPAELAANETASQAIGDIAGGGSTGVEWKLLCTGAGGVNVVVSADGDNTAVASGSAAIQQIGIEAYLTVALSAPDEVTQGDTYIVTAVVTNAGQEDATSVDASIQITGDGALAADQSGLATISDLIIEAGNSAKAEWRVECSGPEDVNITVHASGTDTNEAYASVAVKQIGIAAELGVEVTAPEQVNEGEEYYVSAVISNTGSEDAENVTAEIEINGNAVLAAGTLSQTIGNIPVAGSAGVEWKLECTGAGGVNVIVSADGDNTVPASGSAAIQQIAAIHPVVEVKYPNGGQTFLGGSQVTITWSAKDPRALGFAASQIGDFDIDIYLSSDGGDSWSNKATGEDNDGAYVWTVDDIRSTQCLIRVDATDGNGNTGSDASDGVFTITSEPACVDSYNITLAEDKNLISLPLIPDSNNITDVLAGISGANVTRVKTYDADLGVFLVYNPLLPFEHVDNTLKEMNDGVGYWVWMDGAGTLTVTGQCMPDPPELPSSYDVYAGWNLIGFKSIITRSHEDYLYNVAGDYTVIWGYDPTDGYFLVFRSPPGKGQLEPGLGYWLWMGQDGTIIPPGN